MKTNVYIDGFNLYYGAVKKTNYRWLNLSVFCRRLLPNCEIHRIKYYTTRVKPFPDDPDKPFRQDFYLRALRLLPDVDIYFGHFLTHKVRLPRADGTGLVKVLKSEEKGSDVNLAAHLIYDAHCGDFEAATIISNDSDLFEPIRIVHEDLGKPVGIICPHLLPSKKLLQVTGFIRHIPKHVLRDSQFPDILTDAKGTFHKPPSW